MPYTRLILILSAVTIAAVFTSDLNRGAPRKTPADTITLSKPLPQPEKKPDTTANQPAHALKTDAKSTNLNAVQQESAIDQNPHRWPQSVIHQLKVNHPERIEAINHIVRATSFENFAALPIASADRLIKYADHIRISSPEAILNLCWGHDTQPELEFAFENVRVLGLTEGTTASGTPQEAFQGDDRWSFTATDGDTGSRGTPVTLTWSFVPDGLAINNNNGSTLGSDLIQKLNATFGSSPVVGDYTQAPWFSMFEDAFASWAAMTGNVYIYEANDDGAAFPAPSITSGEPGSLGVRGDIRISGVSIDGNSNTLGFNYYPDTGDMVIDTNDTSNFTNNATTKARFQNVIAHEHGHGLGLGHVCPQNSTKLMEPSVTTTFSGPQFDERITSQAIYGDQREQNGSNKNNDTIATAYDLGTLNSDVSTDDISISTSNDIDTFRFRVSELTRISLSAIPSNLSPYREGDQSGSCGSASTYSYFDPQERQNLSLRLIAPDGQTILANSDEGIIGQTESLDNIQLTITDQDYYIQVYGGGEDTISGNNAQVYNLDIDLTATSNVALSNLTITSESCSPSNDTPDPNETATAQVTVTNLTASTISDTTVTLNGSSNLTIISDATISTGAIAAFATTTVDFTFSLSGECLDQETITLQANNSVAQVDLTRSITLGSIDNLFLESFDTTQTDTVPNEFTATASSALSIWLVKSGNANSGSKSITAPRTTGGVSGESAYLTYTVTEEVSDKIELQFSHRYLSQSAFSGSTNEEQINGGTLEISIDGGAWMDWIDAGGSFTQNGYNSSILNWLTPTPLNGRDAWTGDSGGFITTIAKFPQLAAGLPVSVRWHSGTLYRYATGAGWWIDDIAIRGPACCETIIPTISVTAPSATIEEFTPSTTADFILTADMDVSADIAVAYTLSGDAIAGSDFVALAGSATILSGQDMIAIPVTAITDSEIEGDETLTLTLSTSVNYGIGTAAASITIKDLPFDEYRNEHFGSSTTNIADDEDFDFDGIRNLVEYAFRLDPEMPTALPFSLLVEDSGGQSLELTYYEDTQLEDIHYIVETSPTLASDSWTTTGVTITDGTTTDGLKTRTASISIGNQPGFIRIRVERIAP